MPRIPIRGNTLYYREPQHTEILGVVDGQGDLWLKDIPNGESLWNEGRYIGLRDKKILNHVRGGRRRSDSGDVGKEPMGHSLNSTFFLRDSVLTPSHSSGVAQDEPDSQRDRFVNRKRFRYN